MTAVAILLYLLFAAITVVSAYFILAHHRSKRAGIIAAISCVAFFALLWLGILELLRWAGL